VITEFRFVITATKLVHHRILEVTFNFSYNRLFWRTQYGALYTCVFFGIPLGCGLDDRGSGSRFRFSVGAGNFSLYHRVQTGSGDHSASCPMGTRDSFPGGEAAGAWNLSRTSIKCRG